MQRALRNYRTRTGIVATSVSVDGESEPEWPEAGRERYWAPPRTTAPIENGGFDDTSLPHQERWWKTWSRDQGAFYYWKDGSEHTQWEDPMDDSSLGNVAVRTWGGAELEYGMEEGPASGGSAVPNPAQNRPHANETGTYDAVREVMAMTDSGEQTEPMDDYERTPSGKGGTANLRPERTPEDELRAGGGEEDPESDTAELDKSTIHEAFMEYWRTLSRAKQDELFKEWNLKYPEGGCPYDQYALAWSAKQDLHKKEQTQEAEAGCRVAQERENEAAASVAPHRRRCDDLPRGLPGQAPPSLLRYS